MKLLNFVFAFIALFAVESATAQQVKFKKGFVTVDGTTRFEYQKKAAAKQFSLYTIGKEKEIIFILRNDNETSGYSEDDFNQITFIESNKRVETASLKSYSFKYFVKLLLEEKVLDLEGNIDEAKLDVFITKYDENITNRTIR